MKVICNNLEAEMKRNGISRQDIADFIGVSYSTIHTRFNGMSQWGYEECVNIQEHFFPDKELKYLFPLTEEKQTLVR